MITTTTRTTFRLLWRKRNLRLSLTHCAIELLSWERTPSTCFHFVSSSSVLPYSASLLSFFGNENSILIRLQKRQEIDSYCLAFTMRLQCIRVSTYTHCSLSVGNWLLLRLLDSAKLNWNQWMNERVKESGCCSLFLLIEVRDDIIPFSVTHDFPLSSKCIASLMRHPWSEVDFWITSWVVRENSSIGDTIVHQRQYNRVCCEGFLLAFPFLAPKRT